MELGRKRAKLAGHARGKGSGGSNLTKGDGRRTAMIEYVKDVWEWALRLLLHCEGDMGHLFIHLMSDFADLRKAALV